MLNPDPLAINRSSLMKSSAILHFVCFAAFSSLTMAQSYPTKNIRIVVAATPGGGVDTISRIAAQHFSERWGHSVVVDNRPGAGGALAGDIVAQSAPDGYTLKTISISHAVLPSVNKNLSYSPERDLAPVSIMVNSPNVLVVHPSLKVNSVKELITLAKARPGQLQFSSSGNAGPPHMAMENLKLLANIDMMHIPYKGTGPGMTDLLAGRVSLTFASIISVRPHVESGKLRLLANASGKRSPVLPNVPTVAEAGVPGYSVDVWYGMFAPSATPRPILSQLNGELIKMMQVPAVSEKLAALGLEPMADTLDKTNAYVKAEIEKWAKVVKAAMITAN